jgi:transforming growth factor-beta-induced protein
MKRKVLFLMLVLSLVVATLVPAAFAADEASDAGSQGSIVDIAVADGRFTTLVAAVQAAGLAEALSGGEWTVFAPTDDAFAKLGLNADNIAGAFTTAELTDILLYHAIGAEVKSDIALTLLGDVTMANNQRAGLKFFDGSLYVNDDSKVIIPDVDASNGVIHVVDTVILGPWPK